MNIPTLQNEESDLFDLSEFCHSLEMENFSNHMFLAHKGARTGVIGGDDPFEESITAISPKVFSLLMLADANLCFRPTTPDPDAGIMLELLLPFGELVVYSMLPGCWTRPSRGTRFLGFLMRYTQNVERAAFIANENDNIIVLPAEEDELTLFKSLVFDEEYYLDDVCQVVCGIIETFMEINVKLSQVN